MNILRSTTVSTRLTISFLFPLLMLFAVAALGAWKLQQARDSADRMVNVAMAKERLVAEWAASTNVNGARTFLVAESANEERIAQVQRTIKATSARISSIQKDLDKFELSAAEQNLLDEIADRRKTYLAAREAVFELKKTSAEEAAAAVQSKLEPALATYVATISRLTTHQSEQIDALRDATAEMAEQSVWLLAALGVVSAVLSIAVGSLIARSIRSQLGGEPAYAVEVAGRIAAGDLAQEVELRAGDDSSLLHAMNQMRSALANIVGEVRSSTREIASASTQVADGNLDLSARTEQQASALEETASSMEELTATIRQTSDNARQANTLAQSASEIALRGGGVVSEVVSTMESINQSSKKIADIIGVIDGIAFQTNILALNAAVEAARAGEQGRGFAVVASEVRNLAQRSAGAAREIKDLITDSVSRVDTGGRLVQQAGATMDEIVTAIAQVADMMGEITTASTEQTLGVEQVNSAIGNMDEATQQNAALVEEAAAAAASMREQADRLEQLVGRFTIAGPKRREQRVSSALRTHLHLASA